MVLRPSHRRGRAAWGLVTLLIFGAVTQAPAQSDRELARSVEQLRETVGRWSVITEYLNADGTVARRVEGTYTFEWIVTDRVLGGRSDIPELHQASGILFYVSEKSRTIEMVSVGAEGFLWVMTGPLGGETRYTQEVSRDDGVHRQLRFTRFNVSPNRFESRMDYSDDRGVRWTPGNHQVFHRQEQRP